MKIHDILEHEQIIEGPHDAHIFKAVFLAGGPGSGKSYVSDNLLKGKGLKPVNSDDVYEYLAKKHDIDLGDPEVVGGERGQELRQRAKEITKTRENLYLDGRLGLIIDGTGKDTEKLKKQAAGLKKIGYDVSMIFVNTDLATAQARNLKRKRTLPASEVETYWTTVQKNIGAFQTFFGKQKFTVVDNSEGKDFKVETLRAYKEVSKFVNKAPENKNAQKWIDGQKKSKST